MTSKKLTNTNEAERHSRIWTDLKECKNTEGEYSMRKLFSGKLSFVPGIAAAIALCGVSFAQDATQAPTAPATQDQQSPPQVSQPNSEQSPQPAAATAPTTVPIQTAATPKIAPGSVIPVQLTKSIDAKKVKNGDPVEAKVTQDLKSSSGEVVVPKDTKMIGHVTETQVRNKEQKESQVGIAFDHAVMNNGGDMALPMSIQAVIASPNSGANNTGGGVDSTSQPTSPSASAMPGNTGNNNNARPSGMGTGMPSTPNTANTADPDTAQTNAQARQPITGSTQGVVGISNLKLSAAADATRGSVLSSEKNNVKLESGTFMLLRVNP
jgi:hypothetical protein